jgi:hypothetical protein
MADRRFRISADGWEILSGLELDEITDEDMNGLEVMPVADHLTALQQQRKQVIAEVEEALFDQDAIDDGDNALMVRAEKGWHFVPDFESGLKIAWKTALTALKGGTDV